MAARTGSAPVARYGIPLILLAAALPAGNNGNIPAALPIPAVAASGRRTLTGTKI